MSGGIVDDIGAFLDRVHNRLGLGGQIDLEADVVACLGAGPEAEGDDGETVDKLLAGFAVVDERDLALVVLCKGLGEFGDGFLVGELATAALFDRFVGRSLEEAAVAAEGLSLGVASEVGEAWGDVDDRVVGFCGVDDDEGGGHIDWAEGNLGIGPSGDTGEDIEHVETCGRVDREAVREERTEGGEDWPGNRFEVVCWG